MQEQTPQWKPVALDSSFFLGDIEGLLGIEECTDYEQPKDPTVSKNSKTKRKKRIAKSTSQNKKAKLDVTPSRNGSTLCEASFNEEKCADSVVDCEDALECVSAWNSYGLHRNLLLALARAGFHQPTEIQALALPPAIHGRNFKVKRCLCVIRI